MNYKCMVKMISLCVIFFAIPYLVIAEQPDTDKGVARENFYFIEEGPSQKGTLYVDGSTIELHTGSISSPIIGSDLTNMTLDDFKEMVIASRKAFENDPNKIVVNSNSPVRGFDIIFNVSNPPPGAVAAIESVEAYVEGVFSDDITITINFNFEDSGPGYLGYATIQYAGYIPWPTTRDALINDMDDDDTIQAWLPSGSTIPVRYNYFSETVTDENQCYITKSMYKATIGTVTGVAGGIMMNTYYNWDYDPSDGVPLSEYCFQSVTVHEIGHILGFTCGAPLTNNIVGMDIYRFQRSDGTGDYNPDTYEEFQTTARMVDLDQGSMGDDDVNSDLIDFEYRVADGDPWSVGHFSDLADFDAIMKPYSYTGDTYYPYFFKIPDRFMLDAIGYDYIISYALTTPIIGQGSVLRYPDQITYTPGTEVELFADPDSGYMFDKWSGDLTGDQNPDTILMDWDKEVTVTFVTTHCSLTIYINGNGTVFKDPDLPIYPRYTEVELFAEPDSGWYFHHWSGNLTGFHNPDTITMDGDKVITANFWEGSYVEEGQIRGMDVPFMAVFPNPTSGNVNITYGIGHPDRIKNSSYGTGNAKGIELKIYDVTGQLIKEFSRLTPDALRSTHIEWDGKDNSGKKVSNGVYLIKFTVSPVGTTGFGGKADDYQEIKKLLLLR